MRVLRILPSEGCEKLAAFNLQIRRKGCRLKVSFFQLDLGLIVFVELENDIGEALEVGIDRPIKRDLGVAQREPALDRIMVPKLEHSRGIGGCRSAYIHEGIETDVHISGPGTRNGQRLGG